MTDTNGWSKAELYVTKELERLATEIGAVREIVSLIRADVATLKLADTRHAIIFGALGGGFMSVIGGIILAIILR